MKHTLATLALLAATCALPAAQAIDLADAYALGLDSDPQFQAAQAAYRAALEAEPQARAGLLPRADLSGNVRYNAPDQGGESLFDPLGEEGGEDINDINYNSHGYTLSVSQPIFRWSRWVALEQAKATIRQAEAELTAAQQALIQRVAERYFEVLRAQDTLEFVRKTKEAIGRQLEQARQRFEVGLIAITDVEEAKAAYDLAVTDEIQAENALDNAYEALREVIGEYHQNLARLEEALPLVSPEPEDIDAWTEIALEQNLDLAAARQAAEVAGDEIRRRAAEGRYPKLDAVASRNFDSNRRFGVPSNTLTDVIGLEVSVPLYTGGLTGAQVREARHLYRQALDQVEQTRRAVQRQARNAYLGVLADISRIQALAQSVTSTETTLRATEAGFQVGTRTTVDVVNAQVDMFRARRDYKAARYDYILNTLTLKLAAGTLSEDDVIYFDRFLARDAGE